MASWLAQDDFGWLEGIFYLIVIAIGALSSVANAIIKRIKDKKERERLKEPVPKPPAPSSGRAGMEPVRPRPPARDVARPRPPVARARRPESRTPSQPPGPPPRTESPPQRPSGIPRELLPEGVEEVLSEVFPQLLQPKPSKRREPAPAASRAELPVAKPRRAKGKSKPKEVEAIGPGLEIGASGISSHVDSHIGNFEHLIEDVSPVDATTGRRIPSRASLRRAIVMNEILMPPKSLRHDDDRLLVW